MLQLRLFLDRGANIEAKEHKQHTPILVAFGFGPIEIIEVLVDRDASLDSIDVYQQNCLHYAAFNDRLDMCVCT